MCAWDLFIEHSSKHKNISRNLWTRFMDIYGYEQYRMYNFPKVGYNDSTKLDSVPILLQLNWFKYKPVFIYCRFNIRWLYSLCLCVCWDLYDKYTYNSRKRFTTLAWLLPAGRQIGALLGSSFRSCRSRRRRASNGCKKFCVFVKAVLKERNGAKFR